MMMIMSMSNLPCLPVMQVTFCFKRRVVRRRGCVSVVVKLLITGGIFSWMERGTGKTEGDEVVIGRECRDSLIEIHYPAKGNA